MDRPLHGTARAERLATSPGRRRLLATATLALAAATVLTACNAWPLEGAPCDPRPSTVVCVAGRKVTVEVADTPAERQQGLSGRRHLASDHGMLFVFDSAVRTGFWTKETPLALSVAFAGEGGRILNIETMEPLSEERVFPIAPALLALEVHQGWYRRHGVAAGDTIRTGPRR